MTEQNDTQEWESCALPSANSEAPATPDFTKPYKMLTGIDNSEFCSKVSLHLENGYKLHGSPAMTFNGENVIVGQAVVHI